MLDLPEAPESPSTAAPAPRRRSVWSAIALEFAQVHPRLAVASLLSALLPPLAFQRLRTWLYRLAGVRIGARSLIAGSVEIVGPGGAASRLVIGEDCWLNVHVFLDTTGGITVGNGVGIGHHVSVITTGHAIGPSERRLGLADPRPVVVEDGAWIGAGATLLPGVRIGRGAVVGAGSLVTGDVPPDSIAVGSPARVVRSLP